MCPLKITVPLTNMFLPRLILPMMEKMMMRIIIPFDACNGALDQCVLKTKRLMPINKSMILTEIPHFM